MRTLVTGAGGFIGSCVVRELLARGHDVTGAFRPGHAVAADAPRDGRYQQWAANLDDEAQVESLVVAARAEVAIHMAWYANPSTYLSSPRNMDSLAMTARLARRLYEHGCRRIVGAGSCAEYAPQDRPHRESDAVDPRTVYGATKRAAFVALEALARQEQRELVWTRIFHIHGPGDAAARLIPFVVRRLLRGEAVELTDGMQLRDHLHVADVASAIATLVEGDVLGAVNVCSGEAVTLRRVVEAAAATTGRADLLRFGARPRRAEEVGYLVGDPALLKSTGWSPRFNLEDGVRDAVTSQMAQLARSS